MLSRYKVKDRIGSGGIGVVYRAEDRKLRRQVAIKFLSEESLRKGHMRARFVREARVAAALNHPNICTVHEVGEAQSEDDLVLDANMEIQPGTPFLVMELVEGRSLDELLRDSTPLSMLKLLEIAVQIAEGLGEAHANSIVHRDLKPKNVMVTRSGRAKILDFGMAKALEPEVNDRATRQTTEHSLELTREGMVLGTVAYMSPEQASGKPVDSRSDVFSFGIMLYEMATGRKPFEGDSFPSTLAKILETEPSPITDSRDDVPQEYARIIHRCLRKNPEDRYNDTRDLAVALKDLMQVTSSGAVRTVDPVSSGSDQTVAAMLPKARARPATRILVGMAILVAVLAVALLAQRLFQTSRPLVPPSFKQVSFSGSASYPTLSPDGSSLAYAIARPEGGCRVVIQDLTGGQQMTIFEAAWVRSLRWSPSGSELLVSGSTVDGANQTFLVSRLGGATRPLRYMPFVAWSPEGDRFAGATLSGKQIWFTETASGSVASIDLTGTFSFIYEIDWSPRGAVLAFRTSDESERHAIWTTTIDASKQQILVEGETPLYSPRFSPEGDTVYYLSGDEHAKELRKVGIDARTGEPEGEPVVLLAGLQAGDQLALSGDGRKLLYAREMSHTNLWLVNRQGDGVTTDQLTRGTFRHEAPHFSPDGTRLALTRKSGSDPNIFVMSLADRLPEQLTFLTADVWQPVWSPDGEEIAFGSKMSGQAQVWKIGARGGTPQPFTASSLSQDLAWAPGSRILYQQRGDSAFHVIDPDSGEESALTDESNGGSDDPLQFFSWMASPAYSPDGRKVAIRCNCPGGDGVWIMSTDGTTERRIHDDIEMRPIGWSGDAAWVYALDPRSRSVMRIPASGGPPETHAGIPFERVGEIDITRDGTRIAVAVPVTQADIWLIENFDPERR